MKNPLLLLFLISLLLWINNSTSSLSSTPWRQNEQHTLEQIRISDCKRRAPRSLSANAQEQLCEKSGLYGEGPAECAAHVLAKSLSWSSRTRRALQTWVLQLCSETVDLGPAQCLVEFVRSRTTNRFLGSLPLDVILPLCRNASDTSAVTCMMNIPDALSLSRYRNPPLEELEALAMGCGQPRGTVEDYLHCLRDYRLQSALSSLDRFRMCNLIEQAAIPHVDNCARTLHFRSLPVTVRSRICATARADSHPELCFVQALSELHGVSQELMVELCAFARDDEPVKCFNNLQRSFKEVTQTQLLDLCRHVTSASAVACVREMVLFNRSDIQGIFQVCREPDSAAILVCIQAGRKALSVMSPRYRQAIHLPTLCHRAKDPAPVVCLQYLLRHHVTHLSVDDMMKLCTQARSTGPQDCFHALSPTARLKLHVEDAIALCHTAASRSPALCLNQLAQHDREFLHHHGVPLCQRAPSSSSSSSLEESQSPAKCFQAAPAAFPHLVKVMLCAEANSLAPSQCAGMAVTRLRSVLDHAKLCQRASSRAPAECAVAAPFGFSSSALLALCTGATSDMPARCAHAVPSALQIPPSVTALVCRNASSESPGLCIAHHARNGRAISSTIIDACRKEEPRPSAIAIDQFNHNCSQTPPQLLLPGCIGVLRVIVLDQFGSQMWALHEGSVHISADLVSTPVELWHFESHPLDLVRGHITAHVRDGAASISPFYFAIPGEFVLRVQYEATEAQTVARVRVHEDAEKKAQRERCAACIQQLQCASDAGIASAGANQDDDRVMLPMRWLFSALPCESAWVNDHGLSEAITTRYGRIYAIHPVLHHLMFMKHQKQLPMAKMTPYERLNVTKGASRSEIRRAYHVKSLQWHPDRWVHMHSSFGALRTQLTAIHTLLTDAYQQLLHDVAMSVAAESVQ